MLLHRIVTTSAAVRATRSRNEKVTTLAALLTDVDRDEVTSIVSWLSGETRQPRLDVGWSALGSISVTPAEQPSLTVTEVESAFDALAAAGGAGSRRARLDTLEELLSRATEEEQSFLRGLVLGELRQGALAGVVTKAVAAAAGVDEQDVRRASMLGGNLGIVARDALTEGPATLATYRLELFRPVQPMLAATSPSVTDALDELGEAVVERKLDGARVQIHRRGDQVRVFTRNLREITGEVPDVVSQALTVNADPYVADGEAIALRPDGRPHSFQTTMARVSTTDDNVEDSNRLPLSLFLFDLLHADDEDVLDLPLRERLARLDEIAPLSIRADRIVTADPEIGESFLDQTLESGHEGVMVKNPDAPYEAGRRGKAWRKVKLAHTLDLVVLAVEWGSGRRRGMLSNLHLGARDPETEGFVMLGKTFKGLTDDMLAWQTERFLELETGRSGHVVHVRPEQVVEIAFDGVLRSTRYPGGLALRFARVKGYRPDKDPHEADTIDTVRAIHRGDLAPRRHA
ncbi:MAG: ATP-dependent DNA ligase [Actinobacteria bacterium]|nr:ATP-dependent DNA ligase [Actinomycetota bacterium]